MVLCTKMDQQVDKYYKILFKWIKIKNLGRAQHSQSEQFTTSIFL